MVYRSEYLASDRRDPPAHPRLIFEFPRYSPGAAANLCSRCSNIDFHGVFKSGRSQFRVSGTPIIQLNPATQDTLSDPCTMCLLFAAVQERQSESQEYQLRALPCIEGGDEEVQRKPCGVVLSLIEGSQALDEFSLAIKKARLENPPIILPVHRTAWGRRSSALSGRLVCQKINYHLIQSWLSDCEAMHIDHCMDQDPRPLASSIKVIDCRTGNTGRWDGRDKYLALSYVWGRPDQTGNNDGSYPKLISDAIIFTLAVGIKYLWVDKYCIDQNDPDDVSRQIAQMDRVYESATATLIAASCSSSSEGLPGVSTALRETQPWSISSDGTLLVSSMASTMRIFADSHWSTRGWTYQEALVSRRCFVFTKQQVHFICKTMSTCESANHSLALMRERRYIRNTGTGLGADLFQPGSLEPEEGTSFRAHLSAFTARNLTSEEDILNAFRGILNRQIWWSLWGVPFPTCNWWEVRSREPSPARKQPWWSLGDIPFPARNRRKAQRGNPTPFTIEDSSVDAQRNDRLSPNAAFAVGLAWEVESPSERRRRGGLPMWCWASTLGRVDWKQRMLGSGAPPAVLDCSQFQIDYRGQTLPLAGLIEASEPDRMVLPQKERRLLVTGDIVPLRLLQTDEGLFVAKAVASKTGTGHPRNHEGSVPFHFDVHSEAPNGENGLDEPFPALILVADEGDAWTALRFDKTAGDEEVRVEESEENDRRTARQGRTLLLLLKWDGEVAERRALIEIESRFLANADRERREFYLV